MASDLEKTLQKVYGEFFQAAGVDPGTGRLDQYPGKKFATYPYIGSKYGEARRILFVGTDIGSDPTPGRIQPFSERRRSIEDKSIAKHNPHIAGTYITALYFLKDELDWGHHWEQIKNARTCQRALRYQYDDLPRDNPLSYCALTNYYKFVGESRIHRSGSKDRHFLNENAERKLFDTELYTFNADILVFQGTGFYHAATGMDKIEARLYLAPHPAYREKNGRIPENYINRIESLN